MYSTFFGFSNLILLAGNPAIAEPEVNFITDTIVINLKMKKI